MMRKMKKIPMKNQCPNNKNKMMDKLNQPSKNKTTSKNLHNKDLSKKEVILAIAEALIINKEEALTMVKEEALLNEEAIEEVIEEVIEEAFEEVVEVIEVVEAAQEDVEE